MRPHLVSLIAALVLASLPARETGADCPTNQAGHGCDGSGWVGHSTAAAGMYADYQLPGLAPWRAGSTCPTGCYDLTQGVLVSQGTADQWNYCNSMVQAGDYYQVAGADGTDPIAFTAELWVSGSIAGNGDIRARLGHDYDSGYEETTSTDAQTDFHMLTPVLRAPGEPFLMTFFLQGSALPYGGEVQSTAYVHFSGLPSGAYVISCQSYDLPVPTHPTTWGSLKARYH